jgi:hypothetical protein
MTGTSPCTTCGRLTDLTPECPACNQRFARDIFEASGRRDYAALVDAVNRRYGGPCEFTDRTLARLWERWKSHDRA